jgi:hypothetical protein
MAGMAGVLEAAIQSSGTQSIGAQLSAAQSPRTPSAASVPSD